MPVFTEPSRRRRRIAAIVLAVAVSAAGCRDGGDGASGGESGEESTSSRPPPPTLAGGVELVAVEAPQLLTGAELDYGAPLPSEQSAADAYLEDPEVAAVVARRVFTHTDGRHLADAVLLELDGAEVFDESVLDAFVAGAVGALGEGSTEVVTIAGRPVLLSRGADGTVLGYREGNQLMLVRGANDPDARAVVDRQLQAYAAGVRGAAEPVTPLPARPIESVFVSIPTVTFQPIPPPEDETPPEPPGLPGSTGVKGRYGVVAGERRSTVWAYSLDPGTYPSAESLEPALAEAVSARAGGAPVENTEVLGRVVLAAEGADGSPSVRAFRHAGVVVIVEGLAPDHVDAVITAWLTELP